jgi:Domain of unknown function (DUF4148)
MKATRIATLALLATAAIGFNAYAGDRYEPTVNSTGSSLTRTQVQAEAVKANRDAIQRGFNSERGEYLISAPVATDGAPLAREAVRADALKARSSTLTINNAG